MSQVLKDAVALLRTAVEKLDVRLQELKAEETMLLANRRSLVIIIDGDEPSAPPSVHAALGGRHEAVAPARPAVRPASPPASPPSLKRTDAADRIIAALVNAAEPMRAPEVVHASRLEQRQARTLIAGLVASGRILRTGKTWGVRYSLPTGRAKRGPAATSAPGVPADDDGPGASGLDTSAGHSGVSPAPMEDNPPTPPDSRPPASSRAVERKVTSRKSLGKGSIMYERETDDVDADEAGDELAAVDALGDDIRAVEWPTNLRRAGRPYKPGTRHLHGTNGTAKADGSWWMRPDANFAAEAERMRTAPHHRSRVVPAANVIIGMNGVS